MWKYKLVIFLTVLCAAVSGYAVKPLEVQNFEGGISLGFTYPFAKYQGYENMMMVSGSAELRYNIPESPWDVGIFASIVSFERQDNPGESRGDGDCALFAVSSHYNFRQGYKVNPFVGIAVGPAYLLDEKWAAGFMPTIGVELGRHFRLSADFYLMRKSYNGFALSLGFAIGGRPKKAK